MARSETAEQKGIERTLVLIKPDGVQRGLSSAIIERLESAGLKVVERKTISAPSPELIGQHYPRDEEWMKSLGHNFRLSYLRRGAKIGGTETALLKKLDLELGEVIRQRVINHMTSGPIDALILEGKDAVSKARKLAGPTEPKTARNVPYWTVRGAFGQDDSYEKASGEERSILNVIHTSEDSKAAKNELALWFGSEPAEGRIEAEKRCSHTLARLIRH